MSVVYDEPSLKPVVIPATKEEVAPKFTVKDGVLEVTGIKLSALSTKHNKSRFRIKVVGKLKSSAEQKSDAEIAGLSFPILCVSKITVAQGKKGSRKSERPSDDEGYDAKGDEGKRKKAKPTQPKLSGAETLVMEISLLQMQSQAELRRLEDYTELLKNHKLHAGVGDDLADRKQATLEASLRDLVESYSRIVGSDGEKRARIRCLADSLPSRLPIRRFREVVTDLGAKKKKEPNISEGIVPAQQMTLFNDQFVLLNDVTPLVFEQRNIDESQPGGDWLFMDFNPIEDDLFEGRSILNTSMGEIPLLSGGAEGSVVVAAAPEVPHEQGCQCPNLCEYKWEYQRMMDFHEEASQVHALKTSVKKEKKL
jgi:hypothetical protein